MRLPTPISRLLDDVTRQIRSIGTQNFRQRKIKSVGTGVYWVILYSYQHIKSSLFHTQGKATSTSE
jgi:hypothetical protein